MSERTPLLARSGDRDTRGDGRSTRPADGNYPKVPFDIGGDIKRGVLGSCVEKIQGSYYFARAHGVDLVVDRTTAYFNASNIIRDENRLADLMDSEVMRAIFEYVKTQLGEEPYYTVEGKANRLLNGTYMHGMAIGNVLGTAM